jgi:hypothetical protein
MTDDKRKGINMANDVRLTISEIIYQNELNEEHTEFCNWYDTNIKLLEEGVFDSAKQFLQSMPDKFKEILKLANEIAKQLSVKVDQLLQFFKDKFVFSFFKAIGWSVKNIIKAINTVMKMWTDIRQKLIDKLTELKPVEYIKKHWNEFCKWADKNIFSPLGKTGSLLLAGLMVIVWLNMSFTGDLQYDFDNTLVVKGITSVLTFSECFLDNFDMIMLLLLGISGNALFAWGPSSVAGNAVRLTISLIYSILVENKNAPLIVEFRKLFDKKDAGNPKTFKMDHLSNAEINKELG